MDNPRGEARALLDALANNEDTTGMASALLNRLASDQKTVMERKWRAPTKARAGQKPCDHGLFSDEADQIDLIEMLQEPVED